MLLTCKHISKSFQDGNNSVDVLNDVSFGVAEKESVAIIGSSGSGKSTLLHILGGLETPTNGSVFLQGNALDNQTDNQLAQLRNQHIGFVYQFHHLLPEFTALENIAMPLFIRGIAKAKALAEAMEWLERIQLLERAKHFPAQLSGGERQRVAIARAMITQPQLLLADEPTGNLDEATGLVIYDMLLALQAEANTALVIVTHDLSLANKLDTQYRLTKGTLAPCH